jgi:MoaA/NifB/PqqE/SkfB family radical SAM enzyme
MINEKNKHTWCINAENSLTVGTNGDVRICCMVESPLKDENGIDFNVESTSLQEIFRSPSLERVRENLRNGIRDGGCKKCWEEEDTGRSSKRVRDLKFKSFDKINELTILELNLGNTCNVKCRTCGPWSSSQWIREYYETKYKDKDKVSWEGFLKTQTRYTSLYEKDSLFWDSVYAAAPTIEYLDFYGGEPFLIKKQWEFVRYCVEQGYSENQKIHYNTNTTIWPEEHIEYLKKFKELNIGFSIDGLHDHLHYIRYPSEWNTVNNNVEKWYKYAIENENIVLSICMTLSPYNIFYMDEMLDYVDSVNEKFNNDKLSLYLNLVHRPEYYNIQNLPPYFKESVTNKYTPIFSRNFFLEGIIKFMNAEPFNPKFWEQFKYYTKMGDNYREQNFKNTFPEIYKLMEENNDSE